MKTEISSKPIFIKAIKGTPQLYHASLRASPAYLSVCGVNISSDQFIKMDSLSQCSD